VRESWYVLEADPTPIDEPPPRPDLLDPGGPSVEPSCPVEPVHPVDSVEPANPVDAVGPLEWIRPVDPVGTVGPVESVGPGEPSRPVDPVEPVDPVDTKPVDPVETVHPAETFEALDSTETAEPVTDGWSPVAAEPGWLQRQEPWSLAALALAVIGLVPQTWAVPLISMAAVVFALLGLRESAAPNRWMAVVALLLGLATLAAAMLATSLGRIEFLPFWTQP
jgi:hypothetical protein